ncbi:hypothetical protein EIB71_02085 [Kaistella daneshvariae]|uniref:Uncharacterized protein n=1 Tax=Kaistella daneshvariae TaxID=2487074 RepID=A0ABM7C6F5_9FLAO|nr:hypothetical protein [Kaistella daneshvariae]AZI66542.1 hypothetical protein EIB71_02085 [Kaistella daneshvariae]
MIDYIKGYFLDKNKAYEHIESTYGMNSIHYSRYNKKQQKMINYDSYFKDFHNMNVKITNKKGLVENSLHVLYNNMNGAEINRNDNDFCYSDLLTTLDFVKDVSDYSLDHIYLGQNLEFGFNLKVPFDVDKFILNECVLYDYKPHTWLENTSEKTLKSFTKGYYRFKIYNKAKQFSLTHQLLRIELKFIDKRGFNDLGIYSTADLADKENLYSIYELMYRLIDEKLMIIDNIEIPNLTEYKKRKLYRYTSAKFWSELPTTRLNIEKMTCQKLLKKNNLLTNKKILLELMESKFFELIDR